MARKDGDPRLRTPDGTVLNSIPWPILALYFVARAPINLAVAIGRFQLPRFTKSSFADKPGIKRSHPIVHSNRGHVKDW